MSNYRLLRFIAIGSVLAFSAIGAIAGAPGNHSPAFYTSFEQNEPPLDWVDTPDAGDCGLNAATGSAADASAARQHGWPKVVLSTHIGGGPPSSMAFAAKAGAGFSGLRSLAYAGMQVGEGRGVACNQIFKVNIPVAEDTELSYAILPEYTDENLSYPSAHVAVDLVFSDGTYMSSLDVRDQHGLPLRAGNQGRVLYVNQWNCVAAEIGKVAAGKTIERILVAYDYPNGTTQFAGIIDDLRIGSQAQAPKDLRPSEYVNTLRGTNSGYLFSRGNTFPAVAIPHGFNFWTPATSSGGDWIYQYQQNNNDANLPRIEAFSLSHEPSPWMGDRQTFQIMPSSEASTANRTARALAFRHSNEVAQAHYYKVQFENGIVAEITPTDHAAIFRFSFPGKTANLIFDNMTDEGGITLDAKAGMVTGYSDSRNFGATRMFFYATFDRTVVGGGHLTGEGRDHVSAWFGFDSGNDRSRVVTMKIATSLISLDQARRNLEQEIAPNDTFEDVKSRAQALWDNKLSIMAVQGASHDQLVTLYSNLYRLFLYPNSAFENTGTTEHTHYQYASPFSAPAGENTPTQTGARVLDGRLFVNNGFWDTYRTAWPAYALLTPTEAGEMIDGFVQQYRDGGWIARWSSPGYADAMVGTSSDVAFADAWLKGIHNFDVRSFYQSALKDASVVSPISETGRAGLSRSIFSGYTDNSVNEGLSWALEGYINDFGIANLAAALAAKNDPADPYRSHYADDARYFLNRAQEYVNVFDRDVGFFVGRKSDGAWVTAPKNFDPVYWGGDYTETDAWNMAFHVPHDGQGLANLYGGRSALAAKLDAFFATPGEFHTGAYGRVIHEMLEAQAVRMGQYGHSNQPSHHIIYMYNYAGQPWKTQDKVREVLSRLYIGSEIGQGYLGDEDNGEMSAWWLFSAAGFYPLQMGRPEYVIGAPYFERMTIRLENGKQIVISALGVSDKNRYVQSLKVDGRNYAKTVIPHALLAQGATLDFVMGPRPSTWGSQPDDLPESITKGDRIPTPWHDLIQPGNGEASDSSLRHDLGKLFDGNSETGVTFTEATPWIQYHFSTPRQAEMYTLTSGAQPGDPASWQLEGSLDGNEWTVLDDRKAEAFPGRRHTRAFSIKNPGQYSYYRLSIRRNSGETTTSLSEIELLGDTGTPTLPAADRGATARGH